MIGPTITELAKVCVASSSPWLALALASSPAGKFAIPDMATRRKDQDVMLRNQLKSIESGNIYIV